MKKLVLFKGGTETLGFFSEQMEKEFSRMGYEVFMFDYKKEAESAFRLLRFIERGNTVMLSFNFHGICNEQLLRDESDRYIWEDFDIPCLNIVVDHPFYYDRFMPQLPSDYTQFSVDMGHEDYMKRFYPHVHLGPFLPLAGTELDWEGDETLPMEKRDIDLLFVGSSAAPEFYEQYIKREGPEYEAFYRSVMDEMIKNPHLTFEQVFEPMIRQTAEEGDDITDDMLREAYSHMVHFDMYIRYYYRCELIRILADSGLKIVCVGGGWDRFECKGRENITAHPYCSSIECLRLMRRSRICINVMPWFKRGAHDRIFNTMLNHSVSFTDSSEYLDGILTDKKDCLIYSLSELNMAPDIIKDALDKPKRLQDIADAGYELASSGHTWAHRARFLSMFFNQK